MESNKQVQKAGEGAQQFQVGSMSTVVNNGFSAENVSQMFKELVPMVIQDYTKEAYKIAEERISNLEEKLMPRIIEIENAIPMFADPAFQMQLKSAQRAAAISDKEEDYELLSELIVAHIKKGKDRKNRTGIQKALEIVGQIDSDALCALTIAHAIDSYLPLQERAIEGLAVLDGLFSKLLYEDLPKGIEWLDHLDVLGAVRLSQFGGLKKFSVYYSERLTGYACVGINKNSSQYNDAVDLLKSINMNSDVFIENPFLEEYVCLPVYNKKAIKNIQIVRFDVARKIEEKEIAVFEKIWDIYEKDDNLQEKVNTKFIEMWDTFSALKTVRLWWESLPTAFSITKVGKVLAHTNAKRCDKGIPDMI